MGSVNEEINRIADAKASIKGAIEYCGVTVPDGQINTYSDYIRAIPEAVFSQFNLATVGGDNKYVKSISQTNGKISATEGGLASSSSSGLMSKEDKAKLDDVEFKAEVNQNAFSKVTITNNNGTSTAASIEANSKTDTLNLTAGTNIKIAADSINDKITITNTYSHPTKIARDVGPDSAQSPSFGGTFKIVSGITSDTSGHVTGATEHNVTIPALPNVTVTDKGNTVAANAGNEMVKVVQTLANGTTSSNTAIYVDYKTVEVPTKQYVDSIVEVSKALILKGNKNTSLACDFNTASTISAGDSFVVDAQHEDSTFGWLEIGDMLVAKSDNASKTTPAAWIVLQKNVDLVGGQNTVGLVKNGSSVTSTAGLTASPIINGVPYYENTTYSAATTTDLGLIKVGTGLTMTSGVLSVAANIHTSVNAAYPILFKGTNSTTGTSTANRFNQYITINPYTRTLNVGASSGTSNLGQVNAGNGFYETSDERLKDFSVDIDCDLDRLSKLPKKYFHWKDSDDKNLHIGTSAQAVREIYPELVSEDENGTLSVAYDKLSVVALAAVDKLYEEVKTLQNKNSELEDRISKLENFIMHGN